MIEIAYRDNAAVAESTAQYPRTPIACRTHIDGKIEAAASQAQTKSENSSPCAMSSISPTSHPVSPLRNAKFYPHGLQSVSRTECIRTPQIILNLHQSTRVTYMKVLFETLTVLMRRRGFPAIQRLPRKPRLLETSRLVT